MKRLQELYNQAVVEQQMNPRIVEAISALQKSYREQDLIEAANALGDLRAFTGVQQLLNLLEETFSDNVKIAVINALGKIQVESAIGSILTTLNRVSESTEVRSSAIEALGRIGDSENSLVFDTLVQYISDPDLRRSTFTGLVELKNPDVVQHIVQYVESSPVLSRLRYSRDNNYISDRDIRNAFDALESLLQPEHLELLIKIGDIGSYPVVYRIVEIISKVDIGTIEIKNLQSWLLDQATKYSSKEIRELIIELFTQISQTKSVKSDLEALSNEDAHVRELAVDAIFGNLGCKGLILALAEPKSKAYWLISERIEVNTDSSNIDDLLQALRSETRRVRAFACEILGKVGNASYCDKLKSLIDDEDPFVSGLAIRAVGRLKCPKMITILRSQLDDDSEIFSNSDNTISEFTAIALGRMNHKSAVPFLLETVKEYDGDIGDSAYDTLLSYDYENLEDILIEYLRGDDVSLAMVSMKILCESKFGIKWAKIHELLEDDFLEYNGLYPL